MVSPSSAWDVSEAGDGSVLAWMDNSNLYVASDGEIAPNSHASWIFQDFVNLKAIDFGNCFVTSNVTDMSNMFSYCSSLTELDLSNFNLERMRKKRDKFKEKFKQLSENTDNTIYFYSRKTDVLTKI